MREGVSVKLDEPLGVEDSLSVSDGVAVSAGECVVELDSEGDSVSLNDGSMVWVGVPESVHEGELEYVDVEVGDSSVGVAVASTDSDSVNDGVPLLDGV